MTAAAASSTPLVSVVMPAYNAERFLRPAIDSVLTQSLADFEFIIVDDGSTDGTADIITEYCRSDSRLLYHRMPSNGGTIAARNAGMALASGEFVAVMDADDVCLTQRLERQMEFMRRAPGVGVLGSYVQIIDDQGRPGAIKTYPSDEALISWSMFFSNCVAHPSVMMRRSVSDQAGGYAIGCKVGAEDYDFFQRLNGVVRFATLPEVLLHYRRWGGNTTRLSWESQEEDATRIVQDGIQRLLGIRVSAGLAHGLRGLAASNYPRTASDVTALRDLLLDLYQRFVNQSWVSPTGRKLVSRDAGIKLWLLAAVAARLDARVAASTALTATRLRPGSFFEFGMKTLIRLRSKAF